MYEDRIVRRERSQCDVPGLKFNKAKNKTGKELWMKSSKDVAACRLRNP